MVFERSNGFTSALHGVSLAMTNSAQKKDQWPFFTMGSLDLFAKDIVESHGSVFFVFSPIISEPHRLPWEEYSVLNQALVVGEESEVGNISNAPISTRIHRYIPEIDQDVPELENIAPYAPAWQLLPKPTGNGTSLVNYNLFSQRRFSLLSNATITTKKLAFSQVSGLADIFGKDVSEYYEDADEGHLGGEEGSERAPKAMVVQPILSDLDPASEVVGQLIAINSWENYLAGILSAESDIEVHCVLSDTCGSTFTFELKGERVTYLGEGDFHDTRGLMRSLKLLQKDGEEGYFQTCAIELKIYPTAGMSQNYKTSKPARLLILVLFFSLLVAAAVVTHNKGAEQRYLVMQAKAQRNNALLASLFPEKVRENLFHLDGGFKEEGLQLLGDGAQKGLEGILAKVKSLENADPFDGQNVANLFLETTICFADISG